MFDAANANQTLYIEFFQFLDKLAAIKEIKVKRAPQELLMQLGDFCKDLKNIVEKEIQPLGESYQIIELLKREQKREDLIKKLKNFEDIDNYNLKKIRETYIEVIPQVCNSNKLLPP